MNTALQILTVVLLLAVAGVLYVIYGQLTKIASALGLQPPVREEEGPELAGDVDPAASGVGAEFALGAAATPSVAIAGGSYDPPETDYPAAAYAEEVPSSGSEWTYDEGSSVPGAGAVIDDSGVVAQPAEESPTPMASSSEPETAAVEPAVEAGVTQRAIEDEPEEQPFERDGRWWFKRGGELLVYDERSGQWQPAPSPTVQALATNPTSAQAGAITAELASLSEAEPSRRYSTEAQSEVEPEAEEPPVETAAPAPYESPSQATAQEPAAASEESSAATPTTTSSTEPPPETPPKTQEWTSGSFWKCPSCGAVNGSTAASCRMCFAARA